MEEIVDRVLAYLEAKLPEKIIEANATKQAGDIDKWGKALTLVNMTYFLHGVNLNISPDWLPVIMVYATGEDGEEEGGATPGELTVHITVELHWDADHEEVVDRMLKRYARILRKILRDNEFLRDSTSSNDLATSAHVKATRIMTITLGEDALFRLIQIEVDYKTTAMKQEQQLGLT